MKGCIFKARNRVTASLNGKMIPSIGETGQKTSFADLEPTNGPMEDTIQAIGSQISCMVWVLSHIQTVGDMKVSIIKTESTAMESFSTQMVATTKVTGNTEVSMTRKESSLKLTASTGLVSGRTGSRSVGPQPRRKQEQTPAQRISRV